MSKYLSKFEAHKNLVNSYLAQFLSEHHNGHSPNSPKSLYEPIQYTLEGNGKRVRPLLLLLSCEALGGATQDALPAAAAVELMHNFTLVHDDIMDHDQTRRGRPTVHHKWDTNAAILAGDGLMVLAFKSLLQTESRRLKQMCQVFTDGLYEICEGQAIDSEFECDDKVTMARYEDMILKKTARLLAVCAQIGGLVADASHAKIELLKRFAEHLGMAFQIQDDLLDITVEQARLGKDYGSDVKQRKRTFLYIYTMTHGTATHRQTLREIFRKSEIAPPDVHVVRDTFEAAGTLAATQQAVQAHLAIARRQLELLGTDARTSDLARFVDMILHRTA